MTLNKFLQALSQTPYEWATYEPIPNHGGYIRAIDENLEKMGFIGPCPLCAVANHMTGQDKFTAKTKDAGTYLGISDQDRARIMTAADANPYSEQAASLRQKLLEICQPKPRALPTS